MSEDKKQERVGVYVCHCGSNIAGVVDVVEVAKWAARTRTKAWSSRAITSSCAPAWGRN